MFRLLITICWGIKIQFHNIILLLSKYLLPDKRGLGNQPTWQCVMPLSSSSETLEGKSSAFLRTETFPSLKKARGNVSSVSLRGNETFESAQGGSQSSQCNPEGVAPAGHLHTWMVRAQQNLGTISLCPQTPLGNVAKELVVVFLHRPGAPHTLGTPWGEFGEQHVPMPVACLVLQVWKTG